jgi:hypothetical protein
LDGYQHKYETNKYAKNILKSLRADKARRKSYYNSHQFATNELYNFCDAHTYLNPGSVQPISDRQKRFQKRFKNTPLTRNIYIYIYIYIYYNQKHSPAMSTRNMVRTSAMGTNQLRALHINEITKALLDKLVLTTLRLNQNPNDRSVCWRKNIIKRNNARRRREMLRVR